METEKLPPLGARSMSSICAACGQEIGPGDEEGWMSYEPATAGRTLRFHRRCIERLFPPRLPYYAPDVAPDVALWEGVSQVQVVNGYLTGHVAGYPARCEVCGEDTNGDGTSFWLGRIDAERITVFTDGPITTHHGGCDWPKLEQILREQKGGPLPPLPIEIIRAEEWTEVRDSLPPAEYLVGLPARKARRDD